MLTLILSALLSGQPEAAASKVLALDALAAMTPVKALCDTELAATQATRTAAINGYAQWKARTGGSDAQIEALLILGDAAYTLASQRQTDGLSLLFAGNAKFGQGNAAYSVRQWVVAADAFAAARVLYDGARGKFVGASNANCDADAAYASVLSILSVL